MSFNLKNLIFTFPYLSNLSAVKKIKIYNLLDQLGRFMLFLSDLLIILFILFLAQFWDNLDGLLDYIPPWTN